MKNIIRFGMSFIIGIGLFSPGFAQVKNETIVTFKVEGNCGMCQTNIETAAFEKRVSEATWNPDTKILTLHYNASKTAPDKVLKKIAYAGYDNERYIAPDNAYSRLAACCQYQRNELVVKSKTDIETAHSVMMEMEEKTVGTEIPMEEMKMEIAEPPKQEEAKVETPKPATEMKVDQPEKAKVESPEVSTNNPAETTEQTTGRLLQEVYSNYFALKNALTQDNPTLATIHANSLANAVAEVDMAKLPMNEHMVWMKQVQVVTKTATVIGQAKDIAVQRKQFISLSAAMYEVMKVSKPDDPVFYQFCPMANDGKGATWLSEQEKISNPYFGKSMATCGSNKETIK